MRLAFDEWDAQQDSRKPNPAIHHAWIEFVLRETLALPDEVLAAGQSVPQTLKAVHSETGETIRPDYVVRNPEGIPDAGRPRLESFPRQPLARRGTGGSAFSILRVEGGKLWG